MSDRSEFSVGLAAKFCGAWCKTGGTTEELNQFAQCDEQIRQVLSVMRGFSEIRPIEHLIDLDADPAIPYEGWQVEEHKKSGKFLWDPSKIRFHLSHNQQNCQRIKGHQLREELKGQPVFNVNLLDFLLKNRHLIPEDWKRDGQGLTRYIFFWGTIFRNLDGGFDVSYLYWSGGCWRWGYRWLDGSWGGQNPAVSLAS